MVNLDLNRTQVGDTRPSSLNYVNPPQDTDGVSSQEETTWDNQEWTSNYGDFAQDPHLKNSILNRVIAIWGRGWETDTLTEVRLNHWNGWGKDTAQDIFNNLETVSAINGNAYAEIIWHDEKKRDFPINLKPLHPGSMRHVVNVKGQLIRFELISRVGDTTKIIEKYDPRDIFYVPTDRIADQIHGMSLIPALKKVINASGEIFEDCRQVMHREAKPVIIVKLKTDNETKIAQIKEKIQKAMRMSTDNIMFMPDDENIMTIEVLKINTPSPILIEWKNAVRKDFYSTIGSSELMSDSSGSTESGGKIGTLMHAQIVEKRQRERELQIEQQLHIKINIIPPKSIEEALMEDARKDGVGQQNTFQPQDLQGGANA